MFNMPSGYQQHLRNRGLISEIYAALNSDDYADVVMAAFHVLEKKGDFPRLPKVYKCEAKSNEYRNQGNTAFKMGNYHEALQCYNRALMYAPNNSRAMKLAYSNRSAVFQNRSEFNACKVDIEHCFRLGCPPDILEKLKNRMQSIQMISGTEAMAMKEMITKFSNIFKFGTKRNADIPCISANVEVVKKDCSIKIVAAKDIKVGSLLALEPSFVGCNDEVNVAFACHYCHKMPLNLIPCDSCCFVLFCDEECKKVCLKEFHSIECQIMEVIVTQLCSPMAKLMVKGVIKLVQLCESWEELNTISYCIGSKRIAIASVEEMFDVGNKLSVLSYNDDKVFVHGSMYVASFFCATIIYHLEKVPSFFPRLLGERKKARETLGRLMLYFALHPEPTQVRLTISNRRSSLTYSHPHENHGWYPFIGKLKHSCMPNVIVSHLNKTAALIASQPIKKGTELTVSYMGHYLVLDIDLELKNCLSFVKIGKVCKCHICTGDWKLQASKCVLTQKQRDMYINTFMPLKLSFSDMSAIHMFLPKLFEVMTCLNDAPFSKEYTEVFSIFYKCIVAYEKTGGNIVIN